MTIISHFKFTNYGCEPTTGEIYNLRKGTTIGRVVGGGYLAVNVEGTSKMSHVFVWECCHGRCVEAGKQIDHINNVRHDNYISNLQELSISENLHRIVHSKEKKRPRAVIAIDEAGHRERYPSIWKASRAIDTNTANICYCLSGRQNGTFSRLDGKYYRFIEAPKLHLKLKGYRDSYVGSL